MERLTIIYGARNKFLKIKTKKTHYYAEPRGLSRGALGLRTEHFENLWSSGQERFVWSKTDTLTITSTSQLIVTSAHYTVIAKELDCQEYLATTNELIDVTLVSVTVSIRPVARF